MNYTVISAASVVVLLAVIAVTAVDGYSPTSTKFDWSPNAKQYMQGAESSRTGQQSSNTEQTAAFHTFAESSREPSVRLESAAKLHS